MGRFDVDARLDGLREPEVRRVPDERDALLREVVLRAPDERFRAAEERARVPDERVRDPDERVREAELDERVRGPDERAREPERERFELLAAELVRDRDRRRVPVLRCLLGTSARATALASRGIRPSRYFAMRSSSRRMLRASFAVSLSPTAWAKVSIAV